MVYALTEYYRYSNDRRLYQKQVTTILVGELNVKKKRILIVNLGTEEFIKKYL